MNYNSQYSGNYYQMVDGAVYVKNAYGRYAYAGAESGKMVQVQLTGYYVIDNGNTLYQTTSGGFVNLTDGWKFVMHAPLRYYSAKDTQYYINKIIKANKQILQNNLFCATFADKLNAEEQFMLYQLQRRLEGRNNQLIGDGFCTDLKVSTPPGYALLSENLTLFISAYESGISGLPKGTIGAAITTTTIVVAAVIIASLATAAYFAYKYVASEAEKDVEFSEELTKKLMAKLTPEEYEQLKEETKGIVTKSKIAAQFGGAASLLKWLVVGAAGLIIYKTFKDRRNGNS